MFLAGEHHQLTPLSPKPGVLGRLIAAQEFRRLKRRPRYLPFTIQLMGKTFRGVDGPSFYHSFREIFVERIYAFDAQSSSPRIVDGGANVGLSILFFKKHYPESRIIGFEPSPKVFEVLQHNIASFGFDDVELVQKAIWTEDSELQFHQDGADAGHVVHGEDAGETISVTACSLRPHLGEPVDFLKLDIEGAEVDVLLDCASELTNVQNLFVEYHSFAGQPQRLSELTGVLSEAGFRYQIHTQFASRQPLQSRTYQSGMDLQLNVFAYRE
jgi:FkbM family methyltransferase